MNNISIESLFNPPFRIVMPDTLSWPLVFNSPHSGSIYPDSFISLSRLEANDLRRSEDCFTDELFLPAASNGAPLMAALFPRAYIDINREPLELDPDMYSDPLPPEANTSSQRVKSGLGTIPRIVAENMNIYDQKLSYDQARARIEALYIPYHQRLDQLIKDSVKKFGHALLIDCHSMPSDSSDAGGNSRPDFILGDLHGASCPPALSRVALASLSANGFKVVRNAPYAGGYNTRHYGDPSAGVYALQIEINRALYMDEHELRKNEGFDRLADVLEHLARDLAHATDALRPTLRAAAE